MKLWIWQNAPVPDCIKFGDLIAVCHIRACVNYYWQILVRTSEHSPYHQSKTLAHYSYGKCTSRLIYNLVP